MRTLFSHSKRRLADQVDLWEGRIDELESIIATSGKGPALAYAQSFFAGKAGMTSTKLIEINQRAKQCYKAARKLKSRSAYLSSSEEGAGRGSNAQRAYFNCSATDHIASTCPFGKKTSFYKTQPKFEHMAHKPIRRCLICKDKTHMAMECPLNPVKKGT